MHDESCLFLAVDFDKKNWQEDVMAFVRVCREYQIPAFLELGGSRTIEEINNWVNERYWNVWKDFGTPMADMVPVSRGGNHSSTVLNDLRILETVSRGKHRLIE